ncbi:MAG: DUF2490 domain-containing protein [Xanthomarina gelatinilytica]|uniref:DUF2490 domain-containing protein n=1 Tax=Xanthomarina gelatinilytica TaxID=1137281 RepID=UPI003A8B15D7
MKKRTYLVVLTLFLALPYSMNAQESNFGNWLMYFGNKKINPKWNIHHEAQYRNYNAIGDLEQLLLRIGLGYTFNNGKNNFLMGYGYILSENYLKDTDEKVSVNEHRTFQQFIIKQSLGIAKINHRYRFEQRFIENKDFKMRLRYFIGLNVPFKKTSDFYLSAHNEIFLNTESPVFDRNRLYGGLGYNINKNIRLEAGYMSQFFEASNSDQLNIMTF